VTHQTIDQRSLELHSLIADKIRRDPSLLSIPVGNLKRWLKVDHGNSTHSLKEWQRILRMPLEKILQIMTADNEEGRRRRQSSPFPGILSEKERTNIFQKYAKFRSASPKPPLAPTPGPFKVVSWKPLFDSLEAKEKERTRQKLISEILADGLTIEDRYGPPLNLPDSL